MCWPVTCPTCNLTTWSGCGEHVDQVMSGVPLDRRCRCEERWSDDPGGGTEAGTGRRH